MKRQPSHESLNHNQCRRGLRWLGLSGWVAIVLAMLSSANAENWQNYEVWLNPGRVGHSFSLLGPSGASAAHFGLSVYYGSATWLSIWSDLDEPFTLLDDTVGDRLEWSLAAGL